MADGMVPIHHRSSCAILRSNNQMAFTCPACLRAYALRITKSITLPPDSRSDDILLQIVSCKACGFRGVAVYEESRRGGLDSESWDHTGYRPPREEVSRISALIGRCPKKKDWRCSCPGHAELGRKDEYGRWQLPGTFDWLNSFPMRQS